MVASSHLVPTPLGRNKSPRPVSPAPQAESASDNGSEVSDEGYRSLGVVAGSTQGSPSTKTTNRYSMHSQNSMEDAEFSGKLVLRNIFSLHKLVITTKAKVSEPVRKVHNIMNITWNIVGTVGRNMYIQYKSKRTGQNTGTFCIEFGSYPGYCKWMVVHKYTAHGIQKMYVSVSNSHYMLVVGTIFHSQYPSQMIMFTIL